MRSGNSIRVVRGTTMTLALAAVLAGCAPAPGTQAPTTQATAMRATAATTAVKPRITGGPQPAVVAEALAYVASGTSPLVDGCDSVGASGVVYVGAEVEPSLAVHPQNPNILVGAWQQDRWSNGSARALVAATSYDGGRNWTRTPLPFSRCGGGSVVNGGNYERASDPWVSYSPNGVVHAMSLSTTGGINQAGSANAMLASRSFDHGRTWSNSATLILDSASAFNDKNAITADPYDANYVYTVWDRLIFATDRGPAYFARTTNGGASWEAARAIFDPGSGNQTIGNLIVVLSDGTLVNVFNRIDRPAGQPQVSRLAVMRSTDRGQTWSAPVYVSNMFAVGTRDPLTNTAVRDGSIIPTAAAGPNGVLYVAWQDSRFSGGAFDGIALSRSDDGGLTWTAPVRVNGAPTVPAFTPNLQVLADGTVGVSYNDLRSDTATAPLSTDSWLARSRDGGATWTDLRIGATFDLTQAPFANGLFVGDYAGLGNVGGRFLPFHARTNTGDANNRTDVVAVRLDLVTSAIPTAASTTARTAAVRAEVLSRQAPVGFVPDRALQWRVDANLRRRIKRVPRPDDPSRFLPYTPTLSALSALAAR